MLRGSPPDESTPSSMRSTVPRTGRFHLRAGGPRRPLFPSRAMPSSAPVRPLRSSPQARPHDLGRQLGVLFGGSHLRPKRASPRRGPEVRRVRLPSAGWRSAIGWPRTPRRCRRDGLRVSEPHQRHNEYLPIVGDPDRRFRWDRPRLYTPAKATGLPRGATGFARRGVSLSEPSPSPAGLSRATPTDRIVRTGGHP